jgi:hypothetical protein
MQNTKNSTIGIFQTHKDAEDAVKGLEKAHFKLTDLSIIGRDYQTEEGVIGYYNAGDRIKYWGKQGAFWGGIWGLLLASSFFWVPGVGPLLVGGPLVAAILSGLEGATVMGGLSALGAGLFSLGIPKDSIVRYETAIKAGQFVLVAHGSASEVEKARGILKASSLAGETESFAA